MVYEDMVRNAEECLKEMERTLSSAGLTIRAHSDAAAIEEALPWEDIKYLRKIAQKMGKALFALRRDYPD